MNDPMDAEWQAWQDVCKELKRLGLDINEQDVLAKSLTRWGERLAFLRTQQKPRVRQYAYAEAHEGYEKVTA